MLTLLLVFRSRIEKEFFKLPDAVIADKVLKAIVTYKNRLFRIEFELFEYLFRFYQVKIIVVSELHDKKTDKQEIFEKIIALLHSLSMKMYSGRCKKLRKILK